MQQTLRCQNSAARSFDSWLERNPAAPPSTTQPSTSGRQEQQPRLLVQRELSSLGRRFNHVIKSKKTRFACDGLTAWTQRGGGHAPAALVWTGALQRDLHAVAQELDLPSSVASAIVVAARSGTVSCNPGVIVFQVMQMQQLQKLLGRRPFMQLLRCMPEVLNHDPEGLALNYSSLAPAFGEKQLLDMLSKCPKLLMSSPFTVWGNLLALSDLADVQLKDAAALVARQPRLLMNSPPALRMRFRMLGELTGLHEVAMQRLVRQQPALLSYFPETLAGNMSCMVEALGMPLASCSKLVQRQPSLLMLGPSSLRDKLESLQALLDTSLQVASSLVLRQPSILTLSTELLATKLNRLCMLLDIGLTEARMLILDQPALLTLSSNGLETKLNSLRSAAALRQEWQGQLLGARPKTIASWLCFSMDRHERFAAVAAAAAAVSILSGSASAMRALPSSGGPQVNEDALKLPSLPRMLRMQETAYQEVLSDLHRLAA